MLMMVWPMPTAHSESGTPSSAKTSSSATPSTQEGITSGMVATARNGPRSRKRKRVIANPAAVPRAVATREDTSPTHRLLRSEFSSSGESNSSPYQRRVNPLRGKTRVSESLKENSTSTRIGRYRKPAITPVYHHPGETSRESLSSHPRQIREPDAAPEAQGEKHHQEQHHQAEHRTQGPVEGAGELVLDQVAVHDPVYPSHQQRGDVLSQGGDEDREEPGQNPRQAERQGDAQKGLPGAAAQILGRLQQPPVDALQPGEDRQGDERQPHVNQGHDHRLAAEQQDGGGFLDQARPQQQAVESPGGSQDDLPGQDPQQKAGPGGNDQHREQGEPVGAGLEREEVSQRVSQQYAEGGRQEGHAGGAPQQVLGCAVLKELAVIVQGEEFALRPEAAGAEAEDSHDPQRDQEEYGQPQTGWAEQQRDPLTLFHARTPRRAGSECARNRDDYGAAFTSSQMEVMKPRCSSVSVW